MSDTIASLLAFSGLWTAQVAVPGPNFVRVSTTAMVGSRRLAMITSTGIMSANVIWCSVAALGAAFVVEDSLFGLLLRLLGAAYFAWHGAGLLAAGLLPARGVRGEHRIPASGRTAYLQGTVTALANPQAPIFFATAMTATFAKVDARAVASVLLIVIAVTLTWYALVVHLISTPTSRSAYLRAKPAIQIGFGLVMLAAAWKLMASMLAS